MFTLRPVPSDAKARRFRGFVALIALTALFVLAPPFSPSARASGPWFVIDSYTSEIFGEGWTPGSWLTIAFDGIRIPGGPHLVKSVQVGANSAFHTSLASQNIMPVPGDVITVAGGGLSTTYVVAEFEVMNSDEAADTITGIGKPGSLVKAWVLGKWNTTKFGYVDPSGGWSFDYTNVADLKAGTVVTFREYDDAGNAIQNNVALPVPDDFDLDTIPNLDDNCPWSRNTTQYDGDGDGRGTWCDPVDRIWGTDRYGTAESVSRVVFAEADTVLIALGSNFPDALVAAAAGAYLGAPVLLTGADSLPAATIAEINRLTPHNAYIVGGTAVVRPSVERQLETLVPNVMRLAGKDRYATAADVATKVFHASTVAFVALGTDFPDALVAASPAGMHPAPVLLTARDHVPAVTLDVLAAMHPTKIYVVGGTAAISATAAQELAVYGPVERLAGANRYETAAVVADRFFKKNIPVLLAYGGNFPDALVAGAAARHLGGPVLLVGRTSIPPATRIELDRLEPNHEWIVGGTAVIDQDVFNALP